eukprot:TRINITY_DN13748_c0_g1_i1.p1 TRINITY_DN13748_c0_g1~~TRINITY_DN13748_c0_g1_i1.p1  ORF type:complete len:359 (+),score=28.31 TRINITY_DN13748_c0_g1_i1:127-1203(+)
MAGQDDVVQGSPEGPRAAAEFPVWPSIRGRSRPSNAVAMFPFRDVSLFPTPPCGGRPAVRPAVRPQVVEPASPVIPPAPPASSGSSSSQSGGSRVARRLERAVAQAHSLAEPPARTPLFSPADAGGCNFSPFGNATGVAFTPTVAPARGHVSIFEAKTPGSWGCDDDNESVHSHSAERRQGRRQRWRRKRAKSARRVRVEEEVSLNVIDSMVLLDSVLDSEKAASSHPDAECASERSWVTASSRHTGQWSWGAPSLVFAAQEMPCGALGALLSGDVGIFAPGPLDIRTLQGSQRSASTGNSPTEERTMPAGRRGPPSTNSCQLSRLFKVSGTVPARRRTSPLRQPECTTLQDTLQPEG